MYRRGRKIEMNSILCKARGNISGASRKVHHKDKIIELESGNFTN